MSPTRTRLPGILAQGYRAASGPSKDYPCGALERQRPRIKRRGLESYFSSTLNGLRYPQVGRTRQS